MPSIATESAQVWDVRAKLNCPTYEPYVGKQVGENPDSGFDGDDSDEPKDEPHDGDRKEQADQAKNSDGQVPDADAQVRWPQGEHDGGEYDCDHTESHGQLFCGIRVDQPDKVLVGRKELLLYDLNEFWCATA